MLCSLIKWDTNVRQFLRTSDLITAKQLNCSDLSEDQVCKQSAANISPTINEIQNHRKRQRDSSRWKAGISFTQSELRGGSVVQERGGSGSMSRSFFFSSFLISSLWSWGFFNEIPFLILFVLPAESTCFVFYSLYSLSSASSPPPPCANAIKQISKTLPGTGVCIPKGDKSYTFYLLLFI